MGGLDLPEFVGGLDAEEAQEFRHILLIVAPGAGIVDVGEPFGFRRDVLEGQELVPDQKTVILSNLG